MLLQSSPHFCIHGRAVFVAVICLISNFLASTHAVAADSRPKLYFADNDANTINRLNLDGSGFEVIATTQRVLLGLAVDSVNGKIYWSDNGLSFDANGRARLHRADLAGSNRQIIYESTLTQQGEIIDQLAIDIPRQHLYWSGGQNRLPHIKRINTNGTELVTIIDSLPELGGALELDLVQQRILFQYRPNGVDTVATSDLNGNDIQSLFQERVTSLFLDHEFNRVLAASFFDNVIFQVDLATSSRMNLGIAGDTRDVIRFSNHIYYTAITGSGDAIFANIMKANLDGSNPRAIYSVNRRITPSDPIQLAILVPEPGSAVTSFFAVLALYLWRPILRQIAS